MMEKWNISEPYFEADAVNDMTLSPWGGHRNFVYDLIKFYRPKKIVELGSHLGGSFFSFCQSDKDFELRTELFAIDTWEGDEHAGYYNEEVYCLFKKIVEETYRDQNITMVRQYFDQAVDQFEDNSIDLLHIDGYHSYEAVSNDYYTWLPKLANEGIILFHDIAEDNGYEAYKFWREIKEDFPNLEFQHNWGLGILFPKGDKIYTKMLENNILDKMQIYQYRAMWQSDRLLLNKDKQWQAEQTNNWWKEAEKYKSISEDYEKKINDLNESLSWQKEQTTEWWMRTEEIKSKLSWQEEQTTKWWEKHQNKLRDFEWQVEQTNLWWSKYVKAIGDLEWQKEQTTYWWRLYEEKANELERLIKNPLKQIGYWYKKRRKQH
ncbi:class I SAM-dependent methyltransferase [Paenibacillus sp. 2KB_20]|nr:class I SAM-dependent methyltransferase [Paenibacillus lautus]